MKKPATNKEQLQIFTPSNNKSLDQMKSKIVSEGKQVFLNTRQEIYNKILNRKME